MRVRRVYIKRAGGEIASEACYAAWRGFSHLGYPLDFFEPDDLARNYLRLDRLTLVVGGTVTVHMALRQIGVDVPLPLNVPQPLLCFAGRRIWETTIGTLRKETEATRPASVFVKPLVDTKSFTGCVIAGNADLRQLEHLDDQMRLQAADEVEFASEWRYFIHHANVVGAAHYKGEWSIVPDGAIVRQAALAYSSSPVAYSLDFGVTSEGRTLLVEANDAFALGAHGIDAVVYARMLEDRWMEITGG